MTYSENWEIEFLEPQHEGVCEKCSKEDDDGDLVDNAWKYQSLSPVNSHDPNYWPAMQEGHEIVCTILKAEDCDESYYRALFAVPDHFAAQRILKAQGFERYIGHAVNEKAEYLGTI